MTQLFLEWDQSAPACCHGRSEASSAILRWSLPVRRLMPRGNRRVILTAPRRGDQLVGLSWVNTANLQTVANLLYMRACWSIDRCCCVEFDLSELGEACSNGGGRFLLQVLQAGPRAPPQEPLFPGRWWWCKCCFIHPRIRFLKSISNLFLDEDNVWFLRC